MLPPIVWYEFVQNPNTYQKEQNLLTCVLGEKTGPSSVKEPWNNLWSPCNLEWVMREAIPPAEFYLLEKYPFLIFFHAFLYPSLNLTTNY